MTTGPPDFVGVGTQKSGTTWWFSLIRKHHSVYHSPRGHKELHFFRDNWDLSDIQGAAERYHLWFPRPPGCITGEWTPSYLTWFWVPPLLREAAPDARLLVLLRDPVDRFFSGLAHHEVQGGQLTAHYVSDAQRRGFYHAQLAQLEKEYAKERILVLQYEKCVADPAGQLAKTYEFLGIDSSYVPDGLADPVHETPGPKRVPDPLLRGVLTREYESDVRLLVEARPEIELDLWPNFRQLA